MPAPSVHKSAPARSLPARSPSLHSIASDGLAVAHTRGSSGARDRAGTDPSAGVTRREGRTRLRGAARSRRPGHVAGPICAVALATDTHPRSAVVARLNRSAGSRRLFGGASGRRRLGALPAPVGAATGRPIRIRTIERRCARARRIRAHPARGRRGCGACRTAAGTAPSPRRGSGPTSTRGGSGDSTTGATSAPRSRGNHDCSAASAAFAGIQAIFGDRCGRGARAAVGRRSRRARVRAAGSDGPTRASSAETACCVASGGARVAARARAASEPIAREAGASTVCDANRAALAERAGASRGLPSVRRCTGERLR